LPRYTKFSRKEAGQKTKEQILSANIDIVFIVMSLNQDYNLKRLERYISAAWDSGAEPVIILSKADLADDVEAKIEEVAEIALHTIEIHAVSSFTGVGIKDLEKYLQVGRTISFLGSSGAGKSTLINVFAHNELQKTKAIREDDGKGRHTTTTRDLILLENGAVVIDNPGMRELQLWDDDSLKDTFSEIENIARDCKFQDCTHTLEPNCAVLNAVETGILPAKRLESYQKLQKETTYLKSKKGKTSAAVEKTKWKNITKLQKALKSNKVIPSGGA
jgi:ribosome biogenesis GTPase